MTPQTVIDNPSYAPGWFWFPVQRIGYFTPPKTGWTSMSTLFPQNVRGQRPSKDQTIKGCVREPYDRFVSVYNMTVLSGYYWMLTFDNRLQEGFSRAWLNRWFPNPKQIRDPVDFARQWLTEAAPALEQWGGDLHVASQSRGYRNLLGEPWHNRETLTLITMRRWADVIQEDLAVDYPILNRGFYHVPAEEYAGLRKLVYEVWQDDTVMYRAAAQPQS